MINRIGRMPIQLKEGVQKKLENNLLTLFNKRSSFSFDLTEKFFIEEKDNLIFLKKTSDDKKTKSMYGTMRQLINNANLGLYEDFKCVLKISGVGYEVKNENSHLLFKLGFSHPITKDKNPKIRYEIPKKNILELYSFDKQLLFQEASNLKRLRKFNPYKGYGIYNINDELKLKVRKKDK